MNRDERGRFISQKDIPQFCVEVWSLIDGDLMEKHWEATERELEEIEDRYEDIEFVEIIIKEA